LTGNRSLSETIEDEPESLEKYQYFVSPFQILINTIIKV
jgi:hypothetical protein